jgi:predicted nucleic acid-binding protein
MDLLIAAASIHHDAEVVTFDAHFADIAKLSSLRVQLLTRAA